MYVTKGKREKERKIGGKAGLQNPIRDPMTLQSARVGFVKVDLIVT